MLLAAEHGGAAPTTLGISKHRELSRSHQRKLKDTTNTKQGGLTHSSMTTATRGARPKQPKPKQPREEPPTAEPDGGKLFPGGSYFLTIGINEPGKNSGLSPLAGAISDAMLVRDTLIEAGYISLGELCNPTASQIRQTLGHIKATLRSRVHARFVLFLAGHGINIDGEGWICTSGMDEQNLEGSCLEMTALRDFAKRLDCRSQLYLLDCCHAASLISRYRGSGGGLGSITANVMSTAAAKSITAVPGVFALCASPSDRHALEVAGAGIFTKHLCNGIRFGMKSEASHMTATELFTYVLRGVISDSEDVGCLQLPCFAPLLLMHKALPVEGQFLL